VALDAGLGNRALGVSRRARERLLDQSGSVNLSETMRLSSEIDVVNKKISLT
jgi:hypothetical protein